MAGICRNYHESSDSFEYQKKSLLKSSFPKILIKIFQPKKIPKFKISHPKNLRSSLSLEIWSNPTGMPVEHISFLDAMFLSCLSLTTLIHARIHTKKLLITAQPFRNFCGCWCPQKWTNGVSYSRCLLHSLPNPPPLFPSSLSSTPFIPATQARNDIIKKIPKNCKILILISS